MAKVWCNDTDCWYNNSRKCKAKEIAVFDGECISCRYDKPEKSDKRLSRDAEQVRKDREAKRVSSKIMKDMLERMNKELKGDKKA